MRYRIDLTGERRSMVVDSRKDLLGWLKLLHPNTIEDIRQWLIEILNATLKL